MFDLSILLPIRNDASFLLATLFEIDRRTHIAHEVIVVDRGSDDAEATDAILNLAHSALPGRLRIIRGDSMSLGAALNRGLAIASAAHLAWWTADAMPTEACLDRALQTLRPLHETILALPVSRSALEATSSDASGAKKPFVVGRHERYPIAEIGVAPAEVIHALQGFDETLPEGATMVDLCQRAQRLRMAIKAMDGAGVRRMVNSINPIDTASLANSRPHRHAA